MGEVLPESSDKSLKIDGNEMNVSLDFNLLGWTVASLRVNLTEPTDKTDHPPGALAKRRLDGLINRGVQRTTNWWAPRMTGRA